MGPSETAPETIRKGKRVRIYHLSAFRAIVEVRQRSRFPERPLLGDADMRLAPIR